MRIGSVARGSFKGLSLVWSTIRSGDSAHANGYAYAYQGDVIAAAVDEDNVVSFFNHRAQSSSNTPVFLGPYVFGGMFWRPWQAVHGDTLAAPGGPVTALLPRPGHIDLFTTRHDGAVITSWWEAQTGWQPWAETDPGVVIRPGTLVTALSPREGHIDLFSTREDGVVITSWWESHGGWRPWQAVHGDTLAAPGGPVTALLPRPGHIDLFTTRHDGAVITSWWEAQTGWQPWSEFP